MKNIDLILQKHIDNSYRRVQPNLTAGLSDKQKNTLQSQLDLHYRLASLQIKKSRGYIGLEAALRNIDDPVKEKAFLYKYRIQFSSLAIMAVLVLVFLGGTNIFTRKSISTESPALIQANGSVENLANLNIQDAQIDIQTSTADENIISTAKAELGTTSSIDGVINENL